MITSSKQLFPLHSFGHAMGHYMHAAQPADDRDCDTTHYDEYSNTCAWLTHFCALCEKYTCHVSWSGKYAVIEADKSNYILAEIHPRVAHGDKT